jgi:endonuclease-3
VNRDKRTAIYSRLRELDPHPTTELNYETPFELLVAVILSAQATDVGVNKATAKLYEVANTPRAILDLGLAGLKSYIRTIGLFNSKAENIIKTCRILLEKGKTPLEVEKRLVRLTPEAFRKDAHHWLILHGRYVCKARRPECWRCPIAEWCEYRRKESE